MKDIHVFRNVIAMIPAACRGIDVGSVVGCEEHHPVELPPVAVNRPGKAEKGINMVPGGLQGFFRERR